MIYSALLLREELSINYEWRLCRAFGFGEYLLEGTGRCEEVDIKDRRETHVAASKTALCIPSSLFRVSRH
jgi:hypothetical protein